MNDSYSRIGLNHLLCQTLYVNSQLEELGVEQLVTAKTIINLYDVESYGERVYNGEKDGTIWIEMKSGSRHNVQISFNEFFEIMKTIPFL